MFNFIAVQLGKFLHLIYNTIAFQNYGLSIIFFTILVRILLLPLAVKQYRSLAKTQEIQPKLEELKKRYKNDKDKLNQEMIKLYQENNINPAGGCMPLLIQMPILISLYWVISSPLKYMFGKTDEIINKLYEFVVQNADVAEKVGRMKDISIINFFNNNPDQIQNVSDMITKSEIPDLSFLGINLGLNPTLSWSSLTGPLAGQYIILLLIPILAAATTYLSTRISTVRTNQAAQGTKGAKAGDAQMQMQGMTLIMPFMTAFFAFNVPAGLGLYWIASNLFQIFQQLYMNKFVIKKKEEVSK